MGIEVWLISTVVVTVVAWWFLSRDKKEELPPATDVKGPGAPQPGDTVDTPFGRITLPTEEQLNKLTKVKL